MLNYFLVLLKKTYLLIFTSVYKYIHISVLYCEVSASCAGYQETGTYMALFLLHMPRNPRERGAKKLRLSAQFCEHYCAISILSLQKVERKF